LPITVPADKDTTEFTITVPNYVPPGTYTFFVSGVGTVSYARNPEKLLAEEARLAAIEKIVAENEARLKAALATQSAATKALTDAQTAKKDTKALAEAKAAADKVVAEADAKAKQDAAFLLTFRQELIKVRNQCKAAELKISAPSNRATLTITPAPVEVKLAANVTVKQGARVEVPVTIKRLYGFADPVNVQYMGVFTVPGIAAPLVTIPAKQTEGRLVIEAASTAPGTYTATVQASVTYSGQILILKQDLTLTVEPAAPAKK
jgi:hypothetical protein